MQRVRAANAFRPSMRQSEHDFMPLRSKPSTGIVDRKRLPFSEAEIYAAFHQIFSIRLSKFIARSIVDGIRTERWTAAAIESPEILRTIEAKRPPLESGVHLFSPTYSSKPRGFPILLALLSPRMNERVTQYLGLAPDHEAWTATLEHVRSTLERLNRTRGAWSDEDHAFVQKLVDPAI